MSIGNTILAGNTVGGSESDYFNLGSTTLISNGYNLYGQNGTAGGFTPAAHDVLLSGSICTALNCGGGSTPVLANNGGPTETIALDVGSPAYLAGGANSGGELDQRGVSRYSTLSIGAYDPDYVPGSLDVNTTSDPNPESQIIGVGSTMSLRDALDYANAGAISEPTIAFNPTEFSTPQTITLAQGELVINSSLTLDGPSTGVILNANNNSRVMEIDGTASGITVGLNGLTFTGGNGNGINISTEAGALLAYTRNGGYETVNIANSAFTGNTGGYGGAIFSDSYNGGDTTVNINNSTFSGNSTYGNSGAIANSYGSTMTINNSTISGNSTAGQNGGGGGVGNSPNSTLTIGNTILSGNTVNGSESDLVNTGTFISNGYNLYGQSGNAGGFTPATHDVLLSGGICTALYCGGGSTPVLANNGGPTQTIALVLGSPATGAGDPAQIGQTDQRGVVRGSPSAGTGSASDIGAYEAAIIDVSANNQEITYGQSLPGPAYTLTSGPSGHLSGNVALNTGETDAGTYNGDVGLGTLALTSNLFLLDFTAGNLKIDQAALTITANNRTITYGASVPVTSIAYSGFVNSETATSLTTAPTVSSTQSGTPAAGTYAGNYTVSGAVDPNYTISYVAGNLTVLAAQTPTAQTSTSIQIPSTVQLTSQNPMANIGTTYAPTSNTGSGSDGTSNPGGTGFTFASYSSSTPTFFGSLDLEMSPTLQQRLGYAPEDN